MWRKGLNFIRKHSWQKTYLEWVLNEWVKLRQVKIELEREVSAGGGCFRGTMKVKKGP